VRVCLLVEETIQHWAPFYIAAFRARCEVITLGPPIADPTRLGSGGWPDAPAPAMPNDIAYPSDDAVELLGKLPEGWNPDLVVCIQSCATPFRNMARIRRPTAYITVDTWHHWGELDHARQYDFVFAAQRAFPEFLLQAGCRWAEWLPLGCAPEQHRPLPAQLLYDVAFVGTTKYVVNEERIIRLNLLSQNFHAAREEDVEPDAMCRVFCAGRLAFNSSVCHEVNMRVFEVLAMGRPLLMNRDADANGLFELFREGMHLIGYDDADLLAQTRRYLGDPGAAAAIGEAGRALVLERHTYLHRVDALLARIKGEVPCLGKIEGDLFRGGDGLSVYVPFGAKKVLDIGMGLECSRLALRPRGVQHCIGFASSATRLEKRRRSYDEVALWPVEQDDAEKVDVVLWTRPTHYVDELSDALGYAHGILARGGTLVVRLSAEEMEDAAVKPDWDAWEDWATGHGFHLLLFEAARGDQSWFILVLRKFLEYVPELFVEIHRRFPGGHLSKRKDWKAPKH
jgi:hypothetical protein